MLALVAGSLLLFAQAQATIHNALPRYERRGTQLDNSTSYANSSTSSSPSSTLTTTSLRTSMSSTSATSSSTILSISSSSSSHISSTSSRSSTTSYINTILSNSTLSLPTEIPTKNTTSTPAPTCDSSTVTYQGSVPPTVYVTVTEGYTTTVTANSSYTSSDIYVTPLSACASTVVPVGSLQPLATIAVTIPVSGGSGAAGTATLTSPALGFASSASLAGGGHPNQASDPGAPNEQTIPAPGPSSNPHNPGLPNPESAGPGGAQGQSTVIYSTIYASAPSYTSTVTITKKTPAPVTVLPTSPPPNFRPSIAASTPDNTHVNTGGANNPTSGSNPSPKPVNSAAPQAPAPVPALQPATPQPAAPSPAAVTLKPAPATEAPSPGNIIASLIGTPNVAPAPILIPTATIGKSLGVAVLPSTVVIGTKFVPIPAESSETVVTENGVAYTVRPSEIVGPSTTLSIGSLRAHEQLASVTAAPQIVTAAPGVLVTVGASTAVVQGTTYRFGAGIPATTLTLSSGQKITINSFGVAMPSTTIAAASITHALMVTETAGGLTFSMDGSQVVISGTTFRIGSDAHPLTTEFGGHTVSIGPGGVGFKSTTVKPVEATSVPKPGNGSGSGSGGGSGGGTGEAGAAATSSLVSQGAASTLSRLTLVQVLGCLFSALLFF